MGSTALRNTESSVCHQDLANNDVFLKEWKCQKRLGAKGQMSHLSPTEKEKFIYGVLIIHPLPRKWGERRFAFDTYANNKFQF